MARNKTTTGQTSAKGRKGKVASPWSRQPNCKTHKARESFKRYTENKGKR